MKQNLIISVLLPTFNCDKYIREAINSILDQTYKFFELLIIDGGSDDNTLKIIEEYSDERIKLFKNPTGLNLIDSLNYGIQKSCGFFIARMDADDISLKNRFFEQVSYFKKNPKIGMIGTKAYIIDENGKVQNKSFNLDNPDKISWAMHFENQFFHSSIMVKKSILEKFALRYGLLINENKKLIYNKKDEIYAEDYMLWIILENYCTITNLKSYLIKHRVHRNSKSAINANHLNKSYIMCCKIKISITLETIVNSLNLKDILFNQFSKKSCFKTYARFMLKLRYKFIQSKAVDNKVKNFIDRDIYIKFLKYKYYNKHIYYRFFTYLLYIIKFGFPNCRYELKTHIKYLLSK